MMAFRRVLQGEIDQTRVTLQPMQSDDGSLLGRVETLALNEQGEVELMSTDLDDPPLVEAIALAAQIAKFKEQDVDVYDPEHLWKDEFARLT